MKKNSIQFPGVNIQVLKDVQEQLHSHTELEIIYVILGCVEVSYLKKSYTLKENDIILFNMNDSHIITSQFSSIICKISLSYKLLAENIEDGNYIFYCNSTEDTTNSYIDIQNVIKRTLLRFMHDYQRTNCFMRGMMYELLDVLIEQFQKKLKIDIQYGEKDEQMRFIINYINAHYHETIHLDDIANVMYTSKSTISRLFKKETGVYFADYVNQIRLNYAIKELLETQYSITKIAIDCGFSNPSVFSKTFQDAMHMSPSAYRKKEVMRNHKVEEISEQDWNDIQHNVLNVLQQDKVGQQRQSIVLSAIPGVEYKKSWNILVNAGTAYNLTLANFQQHILYLVKELGFSYVRIWNIFSKKMMILQKAGGLHYNFNLIDQVLDFLVNNHIKVFVDFGRRDDIAVSTEKQMVYRNEECISFANEGEWQRLFSAFIDHIIARYGNEVVESWIYEFTSDMREEEVFYDKKNNIRHDSIYTYGYRKIKQMMPLAMIGGIGAGIENFEKILNWLAFSKEQNCIPDFVSVMAFPYIHVNEQGVVYPKRIVDVDSTFDKVEEIENYIRFHGFNDCKLFVTEWNQSLSNRNYLNDSCFRASYVLRSIIKLWNIPSLMGLWMGTDWVSSYYDTSSIANGGSGMITKDHIKKPVFYILKFLNRLGASFLQKGEQYIATTNGKSSYYIICSNYKQYSPYYFMQDEDQLDISNLSMLFENYDKKEVCITLHDVPNKEFYIKKHTIDPNDGSIIGEWGKFQFEENMEKNDVQYLHDICMPNVTMEKRAVTNACIHIKTELKAHEIVLFHIYPK